MSEDSEYLKEIEADNALICEAIKELGLEKRSRAYLEHFTAELYLKLKNVEEHAKLLDQFQRGIIVNALKLRSGDSAGLIKRAHDYGRKAIPSKGGKSRAEKDPRNEEKAFIKECWLHWQEAPALYKSKAAFARDMLDKCELLTNYKVIEDWCREWKEESKLEAS